MTKKDIVGIPLTTVSEVVQMLFDGITETLVEEGIELRNFGRVLLLFFSAPLPS